MFVNLCLKKVISIGTAVAFKNVLAIAVFIMHSSPFLMPAHMCWIMYRFFWVFWIFIHPLDMLLVCAFGVFWVKVPLLPRDAKVSPCFLPGQEVFLAGE